MNINPVEQQLFEIAQRNAAVAMQACTQYAAEQQKLRLEGVLSMDRLCSDEGTIASLAAIGRMRELTELHKTFFQGFMIRSSAETIAVLNGLPESEQSDYLKSLAERTNWHLASQSAFYETREQWIDAATRVCLLIQSCRQTAIFTDAVQFSHDEEYEEFTLQMTRIEAAHQEEVRLLNEKLKRLSGSLAVLGVAIK